MQEDRSGSEQQPPEYPVLDHEDAVGAGAGGGADLGDDGQPTAAYEGTPPPPGSYGGAGGYGAGGSGYGTGGSGTAGEYGASGGGGSSYGAGGSGYGYPGYGYPGSGYQGGGQQGGAGYPGGSYPGGYPGSGYPGGSYPGGSYPGGGGGYPGGGYPGGYGYGGYPPGDPGYGMPGGYGTPPGGYGQRPKRASRAITYVLVAALAAGVGAGTVLAMRHNGNTNSPSFALPNGNSGGQRQGGGTDGGGASKSTTQAVTHAVSPGIVDVISTPSYQPGGTLEGTGMIISSDGLVLTNNHVVEGTSQEYAKIANTGHRYRVTVLGTDSTDDVALLKLDGASNLKTVPLGNSDTAQVGQAVVALGNAEGEDGRPTVVTGTITDLSRSIEASDAGAGTTENLHGMLETNAPIVEGDSGGALASTQGKVIGMNTAANTGTTGAPGSSQGFAIPIDRALGIIHQIEARQTSAQIQLGYPAFLGVTVASSKSGPSTSPSPQVQLRQLKAQERAGQQGFGGLGGNGGERSSGCESTDQASAPSSAPNVSSGVLVGGVLCGTPVDQAGMTSGAVITSINGHAITSPASLTQGLSAYHPGETVSVSWVSHGGQHKTTSMKLAAGPAK